ncbi:RING finger domain-containing protein [Spongorhabdus nitratireducens]
MEQRSICLTASRVSLRFLQHGVIICFLFSFAISITTEAGDWSLKGTQTEAQLTATLNASFDTGNFTFQGVGTESTEELANDPEKEECPICIGYLSSTERIKSTQCCKKNIHYQCLQSWRVHTQQTGWCPLCRRNPGIIRPLKCHHCRSTFSYKEQLFQHYYNKHHYCRECGTQCSERIALLLHYYLQHGFLYSCSICNFPSHTIRSLSDHVLTEHGYRWAPNDDCHCVPPYVIPARQLKLAEIDHHYCKTCGKTCHGPDEFEIHLKEHKLYLCLHCMTQYAERALLEEHIYSQ